MKKFYTLFFSCVLALSAFAQTNKSGNITSNETWNLAGSPYIIQGNVTVQNGVTLTINANVEVKFEANTRLTSLGTVNATSVNFVANGSSAKGYWTGLFAGNTGTNGVINLTNCKVRHAIGHSVYNGTLNLSGTEISNNSGDGITLHQSNSVLAISNNSSITSSGFPINYRATGTVTYSGVNDLTGNAYDMVYISNYLTSITSNMTLNKAPVPYYVYGLTVRNGATLTIASGNVLKFRKNAGLVIEGKLTAVANPAEGIFFTSIEDDNWGGIDNNKDGSATAGNSQDWNGISFKSSSDPTSSMVRCHVRYAGYYRVGAINFDNASPTINECFLASNYFGMYLTNTAAPKISNTDIGSSEMTPIAMTFDAKPVFTNNVLSFSDNQYDAIGLLEGTLQGDAHIIQRNFTNINNISYFMLGEIVVPSGRTLTIDPGIVIKSNNRNYNIIVHGKLMAKGTQAQPIVFTSVKDDNHGNPGDTNKDGTTTTPSVGDFGGVFLTDGSDPSSEIKFCSFNYGHAGNERFFNRNMGDAALIIVNTSLKVDSSQFKDLTYGIKCFEAATPVITNNKMVNIDRTPFNIASSANPTFSGNDYINVGWNALGLIGGDVTQNGSIIKRNIAGFNNITYVLTETMTIKNGTYISVDPGIVLKIGQYISILVEGGFKAVGTASEKIVFSSILNDNVGNPGDTNGDANASEAQPGNWDRIRFEETSDDAYCEINYAEISYAGGNWGGYYYSGIEFNNSDAKVSNTLINASARYGTRILGNSKPTFNTVTIQNCNLSPVAMSLTSDPHFSNMTFTSNEDKMLAIWEGDLASNATLKRRAVAGFDNIAYKFGNLNIKPSATLTIEKGAILKSQNGRIIVEGALVVDGNTDSMTVFTSVKDDSPIGSGDSNDDGSTSDPSQGDWYGIEFKASGISNTNLINHCQIRYARWSVAFNSASGTISNSQIALSSEYGIQVTGSGNPSITNNELINIAYSPVHMSLFSNPTFSGNTFANVGIRTISLVPETYTQSAVVPQRNFAGMTNVTYYLNGNYGINEGTTITIPAGTVFKSMYRYYSSWIHHANINVKGKLLIEGTQTDPVVFTGFYDDNHGMPADLGDDGPQDYMQRLNTWFTFENVSNDTSMIEHAIFKYADQVINLKSASPSVLNSHFVKSGFGIIHSGVSTPVVNGNTFTDLSYTPLKISLVAYPKETKDNVMEGSTWRGIEVNDETLTQDVLLPKRDFAGDTNVPYIFNNYKVGTSAGLWIEPGVVCKFKGNTRLTVERILKAVGGTTPETTIKFTSLTDDFYGGDTNSDSIATNASSQKWYGIHYVNEAIDDSCILDNVVFAHTRSYGAVTTTGASPTITNAVFNDVYDGVQANGASNPSVTFSDFLAVDRYAVNNVNKNFPLNAENNWWGHDSGPTHSTNAGGTGFEVTDEVDFLPFRQNGVNKPITGDVSLNGKVQSYDASLVLQHVATLISLTAKQQNVAEVSGDGNITAYDASLILQNIVNNSQSFPVENKSALMTEPSLELSNVSGAEGDVISVPVFLRNGRNLSVQARIAYDATILEPLSVDKQQNALFFKTQNPGELIVALASGQPLNEGDLLSLTFRIKAGAAATGISHIEISNYLIDEKYSGNNIVASLNITGVSTGLTENSGVNSFKAYPNPFVDKLHFEFYLANAGQVQLRLMDVTGRTIAILENANYEPGNYNIERHISGELTQKGLYLLEFRYGNKVVCKQVIAQ